MFYQDVVKKGNFGKVIGASEQREFKDGVGEFQYEYTFFRELKENEKGGVIG